MVIPVQDAPLPAVQANRTREWPTAALLMALGLLIAVFPHLVRWASTGDAVWICDTDELVPYGQIISQAYREHPWKLGDPALPSGGASMYPWIQFAPWMLLTRLLDLGPVWVFGVMRVVAGLSIGLGSYLLARRPGTALLGGILAVLALADHGLDSGLPFLNHARAVLQILAGTPDETLHEWAAPLMQYRIITPGLSFLSMAMALHGLILLREAPSPRRLAYAGIAFGYCIAAYFFFWTSIGGAIGLLLFIDRANWRWYAGVIAIGLLVGSPALLNNILTKATYGDEWLVRNEYFVRSERPLFIFPRKMMALYAVTGFWIWRYHQRLAPVWLAGAVALFLSHSHLLTKVFMQPRHWHIMAGLLATFMVLHALADGWTWLTHNRRWATPTLIAIAIAQFAGALVIRHWATDQNRGSAQTESNRQKWLRFLKANPALHFEPNAVVAGDTTATDWAVLYSGLRPLTGAVDLSPSVNNAQWLRRRTLNAWLKGIPEDQVHISADAEYGVWFNRSFLTPAQREKDLATFRSTWREYETDPTPDLTRMGVRYLILDASATPPTAVQSTWQRLPTQGDLQVWQR
jgi:hypothetical protein